MIVVDGTNQILGRFASKIAKLLLNGEKVVVVNAEKVIVIGDPKIIKEKYLKRREIGSAHHGPYYPRRPDQIVRRAIRGMIPYKKPHGKKAFSNLKVCIGLPQELKNKKEKWETKDIKTTYVTIHEISKSLGWSG